MFKLLLSLLQTLINSLDILKNLKLNFTFEKLKAWDENKRNLKCKEKRKCWGKEKK